jgi:secernin
MNGERIRCEADDPVDGLDCTVRSRGEHDVQRHRLTRSPAHPLTSSPDAAVALRDPGGVRVACDSLVALANSTADGAVLFAKNSDRPAGECQPMVSVPRARHGPGSALRCQYVEIPQVEETARLIGSRPFWLWGLEHGLNEHGVAIGNHIVFTKDPLGRRGLTGMDLVRLGLERGTTARRAAEIICALVEEHGQGGSGYFDKDWPYHSSFLIADPHEAYLLETSDRHWALRRVTDVASATNHLTIGSDWTEISAGAAAHARAAGWCRDGGGERLDFAAAFRDTSLAPPIISSGRHRRACEILASARGRITAAALRAALRDHYDSPVHLPGRSLDDERYFSICMHADPVGTTTASMVARLAAGEDELLRYWGSLGSPCTGVFLPYYVDGDLPAAVGRGGELPSADSPWWRLKELSTLVERDSERRGPLVRACWDDFERTVLAEAAPIEEEARRRRRAGDRGAAAKLLTELMADNVASMLERLEELIARLRQ